MKKLTPALIAIFVTPTFAQHPPSPPEGDVAPAPLPMEGKKHLEPSPTRGREKPATRKALPKPPVKPPTPEPTRPDPVQ